MSGDDVTPNTTLKTEWQEPKEAELKTTDLGLAATETKGSFWGNRLEIGSGYIWG